MTRRFTGDTLVIATHNAGKMAEIRTLIERDDLTLLSAADFNLESPDETGATYLENATLKALFVAKATNLPALADDSGFDVSALNGAPGVYSADWAEMGKGKPRDFVAAMRRVHDEMNGATDTSAAFVCCIALAWPDGHVEHAEGRLQGTVVWPPRGDKGFGYDPMFQPEGAALTCAEMDSAEKNRISHRARALKALHKKIF